MLNKTTLYVGSLLVQILIFTGVVHAANGPFGLDWGQSKDDLSAAGVTLTSESNSGGMAVFIADSLPKNISIAEVYSLIIDPKLGLQKVVMVSKDITGDIYGSQGKETYSGLKEKLTTKYGTPTVEFEKMGLALYKESDEFYQCLGYEGCGYWTSIFEQKTEGITVAIKLLGQGRGKGYLTLSYEGPKWSELIDNIKAKTSATDEDAL